MPMTQIRPFLRTSSTAELIAGAAPEHSTTRSAPRPPVSSMHNSNGSCSARFTTWSIPSFSAVGRRRSASAGVPVIMTSRAPAPFATCAARRPIGPGPRTTTKSSGSTFARSPTSCTVFAVGSTSAPASKLTESGSACSSLLSITTYFANAPSIPHPGERFSAHI